MKDQVNSADSVEAVLLGASDAGLKSAAALDDSTPTSATFNPVPWPMPSKLGDLVNAELLDALMLALPFVEDAESDPGYKPGVVKKAVATIRAALKSAGAA